MLSYETFSDLEKDGIEHFFTLRAKDLSHANLNETLRPLLQSKKIDPQRLVQAEQTHGAGVACVEDLSQRVKPSVDALATSLDGVALIIRVADCGAIYFWDPTKKVIALAHSGKKGTDKNIAGATICVLQKKYEVNPEHLVVVLAPCIRPPYYEVDFSQEIERQVRSAGVKKYYDCKKNTAALPERYYSYRMEKGNTGRMWALLMLKGRS